MYRTYFVFFILGESGQKFTVKLQRFEDEPLIIGFYLGDSWHLVGHYCLDTFLLLRTGLMLQRNTREPDFTLSENSTRFVQCAIIKRLANHAQLQEATE